LLTTRGVETIDAGSLATPTSARATGRPRRFPDVRTRPFGSIRQLVGKLFKFLLLPKGLDTTFPTASTMWQSTPATPSRDGRSTFMMAAAQQMMTRKPPPPASFLDARNPPRKSAPMHAQYLLESTTAVRLQSTNA
jgi:hypothetical protein